MASSEKKWALPPWARIFGLLVVLFIAFSILGAMAEFLIPIIIVGSLILFPGKDQERPRLVRWVPLLWLLSFGAAIAFLIAGYMGTRLLPEGTPEPSVPELWATLVFSIPLIWLLIKESRWFKPVLLVSTLIFTAISIWDYVENARDLRSTLELMSDLGSEWLLTGYLLLKTHARRTKES